MFCRNIGVPDSIAKENVVKFSFGCLDKGINMRNDYEQILGNELRLLAIETREANRLTQFEMGKMLCMSESSYSDIETGVTKCMSAVTVILLLNMQDDPTAFLTRIDEIFMKYREGELLPL